MRLFVDTATSGLWNYDRAAIRDAQPHLVRLAWSLEDDSGVHRYGCHLVRLPNGVRMEEGATRATGIHDRHLQSPEASSQYSVMSEFCAALSAADEIIGFNIRHQKLVLERELWKPDPNGKAQMWEITTGGVQRVGPPVVPSIWPDEVCLQRGLTDIVKVERMAAGGGYVWPSFVKASEYVIGKAAPITNDPKNDAIDRLIHMRAFYAAIQRHNREEQATRRG